MMSHNYRIYGTAFLFLEAVIVAMGVRFVQLLAPVCFRLQLKYYNICNPFHFFSCFFVWLKHIVCMME